TPRTRPWPRAITSADPTAASYATHAHLALRVSLVDVRHRARRAIRMPHILEQLTISVGLADPATESNKRHDAMAHSNVRDATFYSKPPRLRVPEKLGWVLSTLRSQ